MKVANSERLLHWTVAMKVTAAFLFLLELSHLIQQLRHCLILLVRKDCRLMTRAEIVVTSD